jgi:hypothetical protein
MPRICLRNSRLWSLPLIILSLLLEFAAPAAAQQPGYHYGWHGAAVPINRQEKKNAHQKEAYEKYKLKKEKMNLEREKNGLAPRPIATFEEWKNGMR